MSDLTERIKASLTDKNIPLWFPDLTEDLSAIGWRKLKQNIGLDLLDYSTTRVISGNPQLARNIVGYVIALPDTQEIEKQIPIEVTIGEMVRRGEEQGIEFYDAKEIAENEIISCLEDSIAILNQIPTLTRTVATLVRALHLIKPESNDHDVSFSEPDIPFSIFVSIPQSRIPNDVLRVAESIIHEAMHLQLTLIEQVMALTNPTNRIYFSPWRGEYRTVQGVLHALYVFRVVDCFLGELLIKQLVSSRYFEYIDTRKEEIRVQISEIISFSNCPDLTGFGKSFVQRLISTVD